MAIIHPVMMIVQNFAVIAIFAIGGTAIAQHVQDMSVGTVMAGVSYVTTVLMSVMMMTMMFQSITRALASGKRVKELLDSEKLPKGK